MPYHTLSEAAVRNISTSGTRLQAKCLRPNHTSADIQQNSTPSCVILLWSNRKYQSINAEMALILWLKLQELLYQQENIKKGVLFHGKSISACVQVGGCLAKHQCTTKSYKTKTRCNNVKSRTFCGVKTGISKTSSMEKEQTDMWCVHYI